MTTYSALEVAGTAASETAMAKKKRQMVLAVVGLFTVQIFFSTWLAYRLHVYAIRIVPGFGALLICIAFAVALTIFVGFAVFLASRGNSLGDRIRGSREEVARTYAVDEDLEEQATEAASQRDEELRRAQDSAIEAEAIVESGVMSAITGVKAACSILRISMPDLDLQQIQTPTWNRRKELLVRLELEANRAGQVDAAAQKTALQQAASRTSPWTMMGRPAATVPEISAVSGLSFLDRESSLSSVDEELPTPSSRGRTAAFIVIGLILLMGAGFVVWQLTSSSTAAAETVGSTAVPTAAGSDTTPTEISEGAVVPIGPVQDSTTGLVETDPAIVPGLGMIENQDYAYVDKVNGKPVRWPCDAPIAVHVAGPSPAGIDANVTSAVAAVASATGLPLELGTPLPDVALDASEAPAGSITISFPTPDEASAADLGFKGTVAGIGGPRYDTSGTITSGWVALRTDSSIGLTSYTSLAVLMHELGHAAGLQHPADPDQVMSAVSADWTTTPMWADGDKYALATIGCTVDK